MVPNIILYNVGIGKHDVELNTEFNFKVNENWSEWHHITPMRRKPLLISVLKLR